MGDHNGQSLAAFHDHNGRHIYLQAVYGDHGRHLGEQCIERPVTRYPRGTLEGGRAGGGTDLNGQSPSPSVRKTIPRSQPSPLQVGAEPGGEH